MSPCISSLQRQSGATQKPTDSLRPAARPPGRFPMRSKPLPFSFRSVFPIPNSQAPAEGARKANRHAAPMTGFVRAAGGSAMSKPVPLPPGFSSETAVPISPLPPCSLGRRRVSNFFPPAKAKPGFPAHTHVLAAVSLMLGLRFPFPRGSDGSLSWPIVEFAYRFG